MDIIGWVNDAAAALPDPLVWLLGFLFAFVESGLGLGFFVPGETIVLLLSAMLDTVPAAIVMLLVVAIGGSMGDHVGYLIGRRYGARLRDTTLIKRLGVDNWDRAVQALERRGAMAVFLTRLVPVIRTLTPASAGVGRRRPGAVPFLARGVAARRPHLVGGLRRCRPPRPLLPRRRAAVPGRSRLVPAVRPRRRGRDRRRRARSSREGDPG
ncbi:DedA family protein [Plantibacter sp. RU18]|uniref:DedA family protein n=1 Tax=Plantibacter sp. RU18 TaxID=3158143 RepID=UPI003D35F465